MKRQLCWKCQNTNKYKCEWFDDCSKYPKYVTVENGIICKCDKFSEMKPPVVCWQNWGNRENFYKTLAEHFGVTKRTITRKFQFYFAKYKKFVDKQK